MTMTNEQLTQCLRDYTAVLASLQPLLDAQDHQIKALVEFAHLQAQQITSLQGQINTLKARFN